MIKASEKFKDTLRNTLQATAGIIKLPGLSPLQRRYYRDVLELTRRLQDMISGNDESTEIDLKTDEEIMAEIEAEEIGEKLQKKHKKDDEECI